MLESPAGPSDDDACGVADKTASHAAAHVNSYEQDDVHDMISGG